MSQFLLLTVESEATEIIVQQVEILECTNFLVAAYGFIECKTVRCQQVVLAGKVVDAWFDEDFLVKEADDTFCTVFKGTSGQDVQLFGRILLAGCSPEGEAVSLPLNDTEILSIFMNGEIRLAKKLITRLH